MRLGIPVSTVKALVVRCNSYVQFLLIRTNCEKRDIIARDSLLGPLLRDSILAIIYRCSMNVTITSISMCARYMNEMFSTCDSDTDVNDLPNNFHNVSSTVRFFTKMKIDGFRSFLNVRLGRKNNGSVEKEFFLSPFYHFCRPMVQAELGELSNP